jgi:uncharacterized protein YbjT (DUF2867 family)
MSNIVPRILITGATGQVGGKTIDFLISNTPEIVAAVTVKKAVPLPIKETSYSRF